MTNRQIPQDFSRTEEQLGSVGVAMMQAIDSAGFFVPDIVTRILENNLTYLEQLRAGLDRAGMKGIEDIKDWGDSVAHSLVFGFEDAISYDTLLYVIEHFKDGLAARRLNLDTDFDILSTTEPE